MGIKHFFGWFKHNFRKNIKNLKEDQNFETIDVTIDNLMIDLNGIFHASTQKVYQYGAHKSPKRLMKKKAMDWTLKTRQELLVFEDVCKNIEKLLELVSPSKRVILCVDGPAPLSKQNQQRQRRFKAVEEKDEEEFKRFDSNCLTPGTEFMDRLTSYIEWYIRKSLSDNPKWFHLDVIFSDEKCAGEGEHKIINYIRLHGLKSDSYCIHGLDADLIMLALGTHLPNFWILREDLYDARNLFFVIDIGKTRRELGIKMRWGKNFNSEDAINDFILLCFMVGNDFLPHVPSLEIIEGGIDRMLEVYRKVCGTYGHLTHTVDDCVLFQKVALEVFLGTIAQYDKSILEDKLQHKESFFPDVLLEKNSTVTNGKYSVNITDYRREYYKECLGTVEIQEVCHEYFVGIQWVLSYYTRGVPDWKWCFKHHYAPFAHELAENIASFTFPAKLVTVPSTPFQQLLSVLPPKSSCLIPIPLSQLLTDSDSKILQFCPLTFKVDVSGKRKEWEGIVLLPMVDFSVINDEYSKHIEKVSSKELERNILKSSYVYTRSSSMYCFKSFYSDISECRAIRKSIEL